MPNAIGKLIAKSNLRNLGVHTEMLCDSFVDIYEAGCIDNSKKKNDIGKMVYTFASGRRKPTNSCITTRPAAATRSTTPTAWKNLGQ